MELKEYLVLWKKYLRLNVLGWMEYRLDFIIGTTSMFLSDMISVIFFWVIFQNIPEINGWTFGELIFLVGFLNTVVGFWHAFFWGISSRRIERYIREGEMDRVLVMPVNTFIDLIINNFDVDGIGDIVAGLLILSLGYRMSGVSFTLNNILLLALLIFSSLLIFVSLMTFISTLGFWITRTENLQNIIWRLTRFVEFPLSIYHPILIFVLTFILPIAFISYYPSQLLLKKGILMQLSYLTPILGILLFITSYQFWKFGLRHYTSTGS